MFPYIYKFTAFQWLKYTWVLSWCPGSWVLSWEVLGVVWSLSDSYHQTAEITFTLWNMEFKIGLFFFFFKSLSQKGSISWSLLGFWWQNMWWTQHYRMLSIHSKTTGHFSSQSGGQFSSLIMTTLMITQIIILICFSQAGSQVVHCRGVLTWRLRCVQFKFP